MKKTNRFKVIDQDHGKLIYIPQINETIVLKNETWEKLKKEGRMQELLELIDERIQNKNIVQPSSNKSPTVYLNVSNACNLRCTYCYANYGQYSTSENTMSFETAQKTIQYFLNEYGSIGMINFFGGEPLIAFGLIEKVVAYVEELVAKNEMKKPNFSMVSNGTLMKDEIADFLFKHHFSVTISIDGPKEIHDHHRPFVSQKGSHEKVVKAIQTLKSKGLTPGVEVTFSQKHLDMGITPLSILKYLRDDLGVSHVTLAPVGQRDDTELNLSEQRKNFNDQYLEAVRFSLDSLTSNNPIYLSFVTQLLNPIRTNTQRPQEQFCYASLGNDHFAVSAKGEFFPCQMFNDNQKYKLGSIHDGSLKSLPSYQKVMNEFSAQGKDHKDCINCWAKEACFICTAGVLLETGSLDAIPKHRCDLVKRSLKEVIKFTMAKK